jgi:tRNA 2-thiouridine synthesizing protein A
VNRIEVDARGLRCPLPVIRLAQAAQNAPPDTVVVVLADDPAARYDVPAWCRMRHHELREVTAVPAGPLASQTSQGAGQPDAGELATQDGPGYLRFVVLIRA